MDQVTGAPGNVQEGVISRMSISECTTKLQELSESPEALRKDWAVRPYNAAPPINLLPHNDGSPSISPFQHPEIQATAGVDDLTIKAEDSQCGPQSYGDEISNSDMPPPSADR